MKHREGRVGKKYGLDLDPTVWGLEKHWHVVWRWASTIQDCTALTSKPAAFLEIPQWERIKGWKFIPGRENQAGLFRVEANYPKHLSIAEL